MADALNPFGGDGEDDGGDGGDEDEEGEGGGDFFGDGLKKLKGAGETYKVVKEKMKKIEEMKK